MAMEHFSDFLLPPIANEAPVFYDVLAILHQPIPFYTPTLWAHARNTSHLKVCLDEGANRLYDEMPLLFPEEDALHVRLRFIPNVLIRKHLGVIRDEVLEFYIAQGSEIVERSDDEVNTGVHNCITEILERIYGKEDNLRILATGAFGGRYDKHVSNLNALYQFPAVRILLVSDESIVFRLSADHHHQIHIDAGVVGPKCGLIPLGHPTPRCVTTGLRWNLGEDPEGNRAMAFGGLIRTSNEVEIGANVVTVDSAMDLVWTIAIVNP